MPDANSDKRAKAANWAKAELAKRHKKEYDALYQFYCEQLGVVRSSRPRPNSRPTPPGTVK